MGRKTQDAQNTTTDRDTAFKQADAAWTRASETTDKTERQAAWRDYEQHAANANRASR